MCTKLFENTLENEDPIDKHVERADCLIKQKDLEFFNHQAFTMDRGEYAMFSKSFLVKSPEKDEKIHIQQHGWCENLNGFISLKYMLENYD